MRGTYTALWVTFIFGALGCSSKPPATGSAATKPQTLRLFFTTELRGTIEPCGCNSDPLGDLARTAALVTSARAETSGSNRVVFIDGGSTLYSQLKSTPTLAEQERIKADLLAKLLPQTLGVTAFGLGPYDLAAGKQRAMLRRAAANVPTTQGIDVEGARIIDVDGVKIGVFGVVSPAAIADFGVQATDPIAAARAAVATLNNAQLVIAIAHMVRSDVVELVKQVPGIDVALVGQNAPEPDRILPGPSRVGDSWLIQPANRGQIVTRLDVTLRGDSPLTDAIGEARAKVEIKRLQQRLAKLEEQLKQWTSDPDADKAFVSAKKDERNELATRISTLQSSPLAIPKSGNWFVMEQVRIRKGLPCDKNVQTAKEHYDRQAGAANVKAAANRKPEPPAKGQSGYVGIEQCADCHAKAETFWKQTKHFGAWKTLEDANKQFNYDCIGCHVTGWSQPGGATLGHNKALRSIQCETCHGPGSRHVDADGLDKPKTVTLSPPEELCKTCHNAEHSDTFDYTAYLRDITGPGHGEEFRKKLGDGPTGLELRQAALKKAGSLIGKNCPK